MKCPECQFDNPAEAKFCGRCGETLLLVCPQCEFENPPENEFCYKCGHKLREEPKAEEAEVPSEGERKHVTVLFSDLSGYTAMSEKLDPEELKENISRIFGEISQIVTKYEGFIEKFIGDAVVALFGVPKAHEDDPIRAVRAAKEIHELVEGLGPKLGQKIGQPLRMHTGIDTGLVVTGKVDLEKGTHGVSGESLNIASRLSGLAKPGEIVIGSVTYSQAAGHFAFEGLGPTKVKGKAGPVQAYRVLSPKEEPSKVHRLNGMRAELIGRKVEMASLGDALERLREREGKIFSICGDAGTGKSRLVEEFKATLDPKKIQWREGHCYAYSQSIPYFPLINLLNRAWQIEEGDPPEKVRTKVESGIEDLVGKREGIVPYIGSLYALSYSEIEEVSPEFWRSRLQKAIREILLALTQTGPTVICLEDIHWADPSSLDLLRFLLSNFSYPALFLCVYRPPFGLFTSQEQDTMGELYQEIRLQDLSSSEAQDMTESLLKTKTIPHELRQFVQKKVEGNPFYLEEVINTLIESGTLDRDNGTWKLTRSIGESDIPSTIQGVISARLDHLEKETKRILQEASVIGRAFLYEILKRVTELKDEIDRCLSGLERLDLIRTRSLEPDLEYVFKHALTQEVVYNGLLKKERREIHERIGVVMEQLFRARILEISGTLAFHFTRGRSLQKAVDYLVKSGEKSLRRYSLEESHQYFKEAFDLMSGSSSKTMGEQRILVDILIRWAHVYNQRGDFGGLLDLFKTHEDLAHSLDDAAKSGMFYSWLGWALRFREKPRDAYPYLCKALELGEKSKDNRVIGYSCAWLAMTCADLGLLDKATVFGERAQEISRLVKSDSELFLSSMLALGLMYYFIGDARKVGEIGKALIDFGQKQSDIRCTAHGHHSVAGGRLLAGDFSSAIESYQREIEISVDPYTRFNSKLFLGMAYFSNGQLQKAEETFEEVAKFSENLRSELWGIPAQGFKAIVLMARGNLSEGLRTVEDLLQLCLENESRYYYATGNYLLGQIYLQMIQRSGPRSLSSLARNIGFLIKNVPVATRKAEDYFNKAIEVAKEIGAKGVLGQSYLGLGLLYRTKGRKDKARECICEAVDLFEKCEANQYLKKARGALENLDSK